MQSSLVVARGVWSQRRSSRSGRSSLSATYKIARLPHEQTLRVGIIFSLKLSVISNIDLPVTLCQHAIRYHLRLVSSLGNRCCCCPRRR